jgi:hypothetical protein
MIVQFGGPYEGYPVLAAGVIQFGPLLWTEPPAPTAVQILSARAFDYVEHASRARDVIEHSTRIKDFP